MGLLDDKPQIQYYKQSRDFGNYQFTSLDDIITQFQIAYVGEDKIISKIKRADVAFHAQRALQELSFDTFKSIKSQEIVLQPSLQMVLPHDYVNYTKISWSDDSGIKHPLYPTNSTSNPFKISQLADGSYDFSSNEQIVLNGDFNMDLSENWDASTPTNSSAWDGTRLTAGDPGATPPIPQKYYTNLVTDVIDIQGGELKFGTLWGAGYGSFFGRSYGVWQKLDVRDFLFIDLKATGDSADQILSGATIICDYGILRVGISSKDPVDIGADAGINPYGDTIPTHPTKPSIHNDSTNLDLGYVEWIDGTASQKELLDVDVSDYDYVWVWVQSNSPWTADAQTTLTQGAIGGTTAILPTVSTYGQNGAEDHSVNSIDNITVMSSTAGQVRGSSDKNSTTWDNYKAITPSENNNDDYEDDVYWTANGGRYGLEPSHAQVNGSFFIDQRLGKIHFSSNISGKTVVLDYISDSLGTDEEMQVHKFAEEAMYKWIVCAILSTRINIPEVAIRRYKKEKFAAIRQAKLRLSNIKLEELTQILRGKSKQIKH